MMIHGQTGRYFHTRVYWVCITPEGTVGSGFNYCMKEKSESSSFKGTQINAMKNEEKLPRLRHFS